MAGRTWLIVGSVLGGLGVALGAFGAHSLKGRLAELGTVATFETAAHYHMLHSLALLAVGLFAARQNAPGLTLAGTGFMLGIVLFSGSLYVLALTGIKWLGAITPFGGVLFLVAWGALAWAAARAAGN